MTIRTNLAIDPDGTSSVWAVAAGTGGAAAVTFLSTGAPSSTTFARATWTTATSAVSGGLTVGQTTTNRAAVVAGTTYTASAQARSSIAQRLQCQVDWYNASGTYLSTALGTAVQVTATTWTRLSVAGAVAPAGAASAKVNVYALTGTGSANWTVGSTLDGSNVLVEAAATVGTYFSGATADSGGWLYDWIGTTNASTSRAALPQIAASLLTMAQPVSTQLVLSDIPSGYAYTVVGVVGSFTWPVPGGVGTSAGAQVTLPDNRTALNGAITYQMVINGFAYASNSVTVPFTGYEAVHVLQSLNGAIKVPVLVASVDDARSFTARVSMSPVAGRTNPPTRYDSLSSQTGTLKIDADAATSAGLATLLASGAPVLLRGPVGLLDIPPSQLLEIIGSPTNALYSSLVAQRYWNLPFVIIDDPEPSVPVVAFTWDNFDTIYAAFTWTSWDTEWASQTWNAFDSYNFGQRL